MGQTIDLELVQRRWKFSVRPREHRAYELIVDSDRERDARLSDFMEGPGRVDFHCERYYGDRCAGLWVHEPIRATP